MTVERGLYDGKEVVRIEGSLKEKVYALKALRESVEDYEERFVSYKNREGVFIESKADMIDATNELERLVEMLNVAVSYNERFA